MKAKIIRTSTIGMSLNLLLKGQLRFLNQHFEVVGISSEGEDLEIVREREGVRVEVVNMERKIAPLSDLKSLFNLYKRLKAEQPLVVHSITPKAGLLTMVAGKMAGVPIRIHTFTGLIFPYKTGMLQKILILMDKVLCSAATHIIPEGKGVEADLIKYNITSKPLIIIGNGNVNGVDMDYFDATQISAEEKANLRKSLGIAEEDIVFIFIGRIVRDKGINELIQAFSRCPQEHVKLLLVGPYEADDPIDEQNKNIIESNPNIITTGFQKDVRPYLSIANCLAFPSYREGFPNVVLQAGAMNLPAIVTNISGSNEIIIEGENGLIIPKQDSAALENALKQLINNPDLMHRLATNARKLVKERFEQQFVWNELLKNYNSWINK